MFVSERECIHFPSTQPLLEMSKNTTNTTLSKDLLYAPLKTRLHQTTSSAKKLKRKSNNDLEQQELVTFLQDVSSAYKPGSSKLRQSVIEKNLFQRALTLVGGGIGNGFGKGKSIKPRKNGCITVSNRKRRKAGVFLYNPEDGLCDVSKLGPLTKLWSKYASDLLHGCKSVAEASRRLSSDAELSGAMVKVLKCNSCASFVGLEGILVQTTANTWRIAQVGKLPMGKVRTVPKAGTEIGFKIHLHGKQTQQIACTIEQ